MISPWRENVNIPGIPDFFCMAAPPHRGCFIWLYPHASNHEFFFLSVRHGMLWFVTNSVQNEKKLANALLLRLKRFTNQLDYMLPGSIRKVYWRKKLQKKQTTTRAAVYGLLTLGHWPTKMFLAVMLLWSIPRSCSCSIALMTSQAMAHTVSKFSTVSFSQSKSSNVELDTKS